MESEITKKITKTIRLEEPLVKKIENMAKEGQRDFTKQVIFMIKKYIEITESNKK